MYEELIQALQLHCEAGKKIGLSGAIWTLLGDASTALKSLTAQLTALQAENAEKDKEIERLRLQHPVQVDGDVMALTLELAETKAALSRVEAERDALRNSVADFIVENADCLKIAIDTQDRHYLEVLIAQWRGAQGEG